MMQIRTIDVTAVRQNVTLGFRLTVSGVVIALSLMLFIYPAITICLTVMDSQLNQTGESRLVPIWFNSVAPRYLSWANTYLDTHYGTSLYHDDIPATEWPIFGSITLRWSSLSAPDHSSVPLATSSSGQTAHQILPKKTAKRIDAWIARQRLGAE